MKAPFDVWINPDTYVKLNEYATAAQPTEIGGLARITIDGDDVFVIDVEMLEQEATGGTFDIDKDDIQKFALKLVQEDREDEMSEWCSIVHSHPIGMSASMSTTDVDAIKRFAEDEDAFSLIIGTSKDANSTELKMHYCCTINGKKIIFDDMPVHIAYSVERLNQGEELANNLAKHFGVDKNEKDMKQLKNMCRTFMASKLPHMWSDERAKLRREIEADVKKLIKPSKSLVKGGWSGNSRWSHGTWYNSDDDYEAMADAAYSGSFAGATRLGQKTVSQLKTLDHLYKEAFLSPDSPPERRQKAKNSWRNLVITVNNVLRFEGGIGIGDMVQINPDECKVTAENMHLLTGMHEVQGASGDYNTTMYVDGEAFFPEELLLIKPCLAVWEEEDALEEATRPDGAVA